MIFCPDCGGLASMLAPFIGAGAALFILKIESKIRSFFKKDNKKQKHKKE